MDGHQKTSWSLPGKFCSATSKCQLEALGQGSQGQHIHSHRHSRSLPCTVAGSRAGVDGTIRGTPHWHRSLLGGRWGRGTSHRSRKQSKGHPLALNPLHCKTHPGSSTCWGPSGSHWHLGTGRRLGSRNPQCTAAHTPWLGNGPTAATDT